ncbi:AMP phosphorylase [uncultured archaeon]|nr:AMP phosphorylase [uncultured archaeon]
MVELKIKFLKWSAGLPVAMLNEETAKTNGIHAKDRIFLKTSSGFQYSTIVDTVKDLVGKNEIAVSFELKEQLNLKLDQKVRISLAPPLKTTQYIKNKLLGKELSAKEIDEIIKDVVMNSMSEAEIGFFVAAMYKNGMTSEETVDLTRAIYENGNKLSFKERTIVDKHCIGGIPGNRTSPIVVSICTAAGLIMPKSSSRAITSAAGTADVIETVADVEFKKEEMKKIIQDTGGCIVWGGGFGMVTADAKIIQIEKVLNLDPQAQMLASVFSKKLAMGSHFILIDIPYGKTAKVPTLEKAKELKRKFELLGRKFNKKLIVVITDGSQPVGNGIGPALELKDVVNVLDPKKNGPGDLQTKAVFLAGQLLELTNKAKKGCGEKLALEILQSGKAFEKFKQIIKRQNGNLNRLEHTSKFKQDIISDKSGKVSEFDNKSLAFIARLAGCPSDKFTGIYLYRHLGDRIEKGQPLLTLYSESRTRLDDAIECYNSKKPILIN